MSKQKVRKAVLTDAGYATRFLPITKTLPKSMLPIWDKPITQYLVEECMGAGITEIIIVTTEEGRPIYEDYFHNSVQHIHEQLQKQGKEKRFDKVRDVFSLPSIVVITQDKNLPYGNGTPALCAKPYIGNEPFIYCFTDDVVLGHSRAKEMINRYMESPDEVKGVIPAKEIHGVDVTKYGMIKLKDSTKDELEYIIEKPSPEESPSDLVSFSGYVLDPMIFDYLAPTTDNLGKDAELWMVDAIQRMANDHKILVQPITGNWVTTGDPLNYLISVLDYTLDHEEDSRQELVNYLKEKLFEMDDECCGDGSCGCGGHGDGEGKKHGHGGCCGGNGN